MSTSLITNGGGLSNKDLSEATATVPDVISGKTFYAGDKDIKTGTMTNNGAWNGTAVPGGSITIPAGYHNGEGKITAQSAIVKTASVSTISVGAHTTGTRDVSVSYSELGLTKAPKVTVAFAVGYCYGGDNADTYEGASLRSATATSATARASFNYNGTGSGRCNGTMYFFIVPQ